MSEAPKNQEVRLNDVFHHILRDRLDRAGSEPERQAYIKLARFVRAEVEKSMRAHGVPTPRIFNELWHGIEEHPVFQELSAADREGALHKVFRTIQAGVFQRGGVMITRIDSAAVLSDDEGARQDLTMALGQIAMGNIISAEQYARSAVEKTNDVDTLIEIGNRLIETTLVEFGRGAYLKAVEEMPVASFSSQEKKEKLRYLIQYIERFGDPKKTKPAYVQLAEHEEEEDALRQIAGKLLEEWNDSRTARLVYLKILNMTFDKANSYETCVKAGEAAILANEMDKAIEVYLKAAGYVTGETGEDAAKLAALRVALIALGADTRILEIARRIEYIRQQCPAPKFFTYRMNAVNIPRGKQCVEVHGNIPDRESALSIARVCFRQAGEEEWNLVDSFDPIELTFAQILQAGDYEFTIFYTGEIDDACVQSEITKLNIERADKRPPVAAPQVISQEFYKRHGKTKVRILIAIDSAPANHPTMALNFRAEKDGVPITTGAAGDKWSHSKKFRPGATIGTLVVPAGCTLFLQALNRFNDEGNSEPISVMDSPPADDSGRRPECEEEIAAAAGDSEAAATVRLPVISKADDGFEGEPTIIDFRMPPAAEAGEVLAGEIDVSRLPSSVAPSVPPVYPALPSVIVDESADSGDWGAAMEEAWFGEGEVPEGLAVSARLRMLVQGTGSADDIEAFGQFPNIQGMPVIPEREIEREDAVKKRKQTRVSDTQTRQLLREIKKRPNHGKK